MHCPPYPTRHSFRTEYVGRYIQKRNVGKKLQRFFAELKILITILGCCQTTITIVIVKSIAQIQTTFYSILEIIWFCIII